jgi:hypothetical protein
LPNNLFVATAYDYKREARMLRLRDMNAPYDTTSAVRRSCQPGQSAETCVRPDPGRGQVVTMESTGSGNAHNLTLNVRQRFSIFNVSAEYVFHRARNNGNPRPELQTDNYNLQADWARRVSPLHTVSNTVNARLPLGIFLTKRIDFNSGRFYDVMTGRDDNRDGNINDRPVGVPRNIARGPRYFNVNFNISKALFLDATGGAGVRKNINVFANMINAFNRVHYGVPSGVMTSPNFGRSTSATQPRVVEIGLRFQF